MSLDAWEITRDSRLSDRTHVEELTILEALSADVRNVPCTSCHVMSYMQVISQRFCLLRAFHPLSFPFDIQRTHGSVNMSSEWEVITVGGGPVGLSLAYQLTRLGILTLTIEQFDKTQQDMYGRACTLYPRTIEMLDQLGLLDEMLQVGFIGRGSVTYKDGQRVNDRGWDFLSRMTDTYLDYCLNIRQKYSEDIFRSALERYSVNVNAGWSLKDFTIDDAVGNYKIPATMTDSKGAAVTARSKYIIGADGGQSTVCSIAGIPFVGECSEFHWVRIDAVIDKDMPQSRIGFGGDGR
jgi:phenol 2-monooxygenase